MTRDQSEVLAREIIGTAIQRCAADHTAETTVSVVALPNDEMKGRIIGREGRNIRSIESITGVELIIDDTPEAITVSAFDPVRREIARLTLERLIQDGRIHPTRIEELYEKAKREVNATIKQEGEKAVLKANCGSIHPELVRLLGKLKYRTSYGQSVLKHSLEVSYIAGLMAAELVLMSAWPAAQVCCTTSARLWITRWKAAILPWAWNLPASIKRAKPLCTPSRRITVM